MHYIEYQNISAILRSDYLQKKNGKNWENQYEKEVALIIKKYPIKEIER